MVCGRVFAVRGMMCARNKMVFFSKFLVPLFIDLHRWRRNTKRLSKGGKGGDEMS